MLETPSEVASTVGMTTTLEPQGETSAMAGPPPSGGRLNAKLNWLRAGVLGANDGVVSVGGLVMGVAGATSSSSALLVAGLAGMVAGALSMAGGEFVSVSSQRDTELAAIEAERVRLAAQPAKELAALTELYRAKGLSGETAATVALEFTAKDALGAHVEAKLGIDRNERTSPWQAAFASMAAFLMGALIPLLAMVVSPPEIRVICTVVAVSVALLVTGLTSGLLGGASPIRPMLRNLVVGSLAMGLTYAVGHLVGTQL